MILELLSLGNLATWAFCSLLIYLSLNFRLYMIFHHPGRKLKAKTKVARSSDAPMIRSERLNES